MRFLVLWWMSQQPYVMEFRQRDSAEAAAKVRNALMIEIDGHGKVVSVVDWYRRTDEGKPMPAEWRETGRIGSPM
jgi:hypothetical protein